MRGANSVMTLLLSMLQMQFRNPMLTLQNGSPLSPLRPSNSPAKPTHRPASVSSPLRPHRLSFFDDATCTNSDASDSHHSTHSAPGVIIHQQSCVPGSVGVANPLLSSSPDSGPLSTHSALATVGTAAARVYRGSRITTRRSLRVLRKY